MALQRTLQPTLWRTCRAIANPTRLLLLDRVRRKPGQNVSAIAARLRLRVSLVSQYLRTLEARGLLRARRVGRHVVYDPPAPSTGPASELASALPTALVGGTRSRQNLFRLATAFTHPRRISIYRAILQHPRTAKQIRSATGIPERALDRHLKKLESRGFIHLRRGAYCRSSVDNQFARVLASLAGDEP
jgi:DNA-binding MarR family transcriptional regulator